MKTIRAPKDDEVFDIFHEIGAEEFQKTPPHRMAARIRRLTDDAKARDATAEENGLLAGFLDALAETSTADLRKMGFKVTHPDKPKMQGEVKVIASPARKISVSLVKK